MKVAFFETSRSTLRHTTPNDGEPLQALSAIAYSVFYAVYYVSHFGWSLTGLIFFVALAPSIGLNLSNYWKNSWILVGSLSIATIY